ncbi:hypothetical protein Ocin01_19785 [Orchesella cincta]|uniref:Uncharacterized protein n=1 Tax=Orchesella cincta TaxID=48709 RepID=A0A1D2M1Q1_ORCCI|nr:hypothetical protein Ocin01_19785 [Orchesella cincta]
MRCSHLVMLIVVLPVLLSSLEIQLAQGIKCYSCGPCPGKGEERKWSGSMTPVRNYKDEGFQIPSAFPDLLIQSDRRPCQGER